MMEKLSREIAFEIFYRLPPKTVVQCKVVCKSWCSLLSPSDDGNYFAIMHLRRRRHQLNPDYSTLSSISLQEEFRHNDQEEEGSVVGNFHITEYNEVEGLHCTVKRLTFSQIFISGWFMSMTTLVGSCNGLLCLTRAYHHRQRGANSFKTIIGICNPLLHEYVTLPLSDLQFKHDDCSAAERVVTAFGHSPITDEYKVVRVYYRRQFSGYIGDVEVYTLGKSSSNGAAGMWRSKGTIEYTLRSVLQSGSRPVLINGSIHWSTKTGSEQNIVSFDLEDEEFRAIPLPNDLNIINMPELRELRGCLCLIGETRDQNRNLDIWVLKDYMNKESWVKEFSIKWVTRGSGLWYSPVAIKKNKKDGDAILCWCNSDIAPNRLVSYDPKIQKFEMVEGRQDVVNGLTFDSVLHINSLVSLKALGEDAKYAKESRPLDKLDVRV